MQTPDSPLPNRPPIKARRKVYLRLRRRPLNPLRPEARPGAPEEQEPQRPAPSATSEARDELRRLRAEVQSLTAELEEKAASEKALREAADQARTQVLRARANMDNQRKRLSREREEQKRFAAEDVLAQLFSPLEHFRLALEAAPAKQGEESLHHGVSMVYRELLSIVEGVGLEEISPLGEEFNPNLHEAVSSRPDHTKPDNVVLRVLRPGYKLHEKVLRPALVEVNTLPEKRPKAPPPAPDSAPAPDAPAGRPKARPPSREAIKRLDDPIEQARRMLETRHDED